MDVVRPFSLALAAVVMSAAVPSAAKPSRIVILRHGEKADAWKLCAVGDERAAALAANYLGKGAANSLFDADGPAAIVAITLHTLELIAPTAASWGLPIDLYSVVPEPHQTKADFTLALNRRTGEAVARVMTDPALDGKTVVMSWEHVHIANAKLEQQFPNEAVTLRQLLHLDTFADVPTTWPGENYDYFWIVDFGVGPNPTSFKAVRQEFGGKFANVPSNEWGKPNGLTSASGCIRLEGGEDG